MSVLGALAIFGLCVVAYCVAVAAFVRIERESGGKTPKENQ